ncbi:tyrosine-type recombinase/integrase [Lentisalinibacter salinarum]|uniref:tyrosine-type recombinase/integrase n=1 Tax=Lentisalinibacter salinarum TaxID=2992239 RepID=UPI00386E15EB
MGRSKTAHIKFLENSNLANLNVLDINPSDLIAHVRERRKAGAGASTVNNDIIWLRVILRYARAAWEVLFDLSIIDDAYSVLRAEKLVSKARVRTRRPTDEELNALTEYFRQRDRRSALPMVDILWFAIHSARRQSEITNLLWADNDKNTQTGIVRNLKHPTEREYFRRFKYAPDAWSIVCRQKKVAARIFPYNPKTIGAAFTRACRVLEIEDLRFHDLRHEATSRLFEAGYSIVEVQQFTLHDSWATLNRYTHLRPEAVVIRSNPDTGNTVREPTATYTRPPSAAPRTTETPLPTQQVSSNCSGSHKLDRRELIRCYVQPDLIT